MLLNRRLASLALAAAAAAAQADPNTQFVYDLSAPRTPVSSVDFIGTADLLGGGRAFARFHDGSRDEADFVVAGTGDIRIATAQTAAFVVVAGSDAADDPGMPQEWRVSNLDTSRTLVGFSIELAQVGTAGAFDIHFGTNLLEEGTPGSRTGRTLLMDFQGRSFITGSYTVTYSQPIALQGAGVIGDLFGRVDVSLAYANQGLNGGLPPITLFGGMFSSQKFASDLDRVAYAPVPEPATWALMLGGAALLMMRRRPRA